MRRWIDSRTMPPLSTSGADPTGGADIPAAGSADLAWMRDHAIRLK